MQHGAANDRRQVIPAQQVRLFAEGGGSLFASGVDPGWGNDVLPLLLSGLGTTIDVIRCQEIFDYSTYDQQYAVARKLLEDNRDKVEAMAKALLEMETIDADQIADIMGGKPPRPPKPTPAST